MRFLSGTLSAAFLGMATEAFVPSSLSRNQQRRVIKPLGVSGWDNEDFLKALSPPNSGDDELPEVGIEGATLSEDMKEKMRREDEVAGGGSRLKKLMEEARQRAEQAATVRPVENPFIANPYAGLDGLDPQQQPSTPQMPANLDEMSDEEQARLFRQMMQGQQPSVPVPAEQPLIVPPLPRPPRPDAKPGRNRDADSIQNTADVYFAQLKRDSTVRAVARIQGDNEKSNEVFKDPKINELNKMLTVNPHLQENRDKEMELIETATEEMIAFQMAQESKRVNKSTTGISYKKKLEERKKRMAGGGSKAPEQAQATLEESKEPEPEAAAPPALELIKVETPVEAPSSPPTVETPVAVEESVAVAPPTAEPKPLEPPMEAVAQSPVSTTPPPVVEQQSTPAAAPPVTPKSRPDEIRQSLRTLMGLLLKHRGGPGFGAGGLKGPDIPRYESLSNEIIALLKEEGISNVEAKQQQPVENVTPMPPAEPISGELAKVPNSPTAEAQVESMLACIEGAILMYRNSPPELQEGVFMTIRAALVSAVNTSSKLMGQSNEFPSVTSAAPKIDSMLACLEGAILMYRNSPDDLKMSVLVTLRAAMVSALNSCNKILAEKGIDQVTTPTAVSSKPDQFYDAVQVEDEAEQEVSIPESVASATTDPNSEALEKIYNSLQAASGDGKMGLRSDLSPEEASFLADNIVEAKSILMEELDTGIPTGATGAGGGGSSSASTYQQMLAKARAAKA